MLRQDSEAIPRKADNASIGQLNEIDPLFNPGAKGTRLDFIYREIHKKNSVYFLFAQPPHSNRNRSYLKNRKAWVNTERKTILPQKRCIFSKTFSYFNQINPLQEYPEIHVQ
jgi:hypothetical protein